MTRDGDMSGGHPNGADSRTWKPESLCDPLIEIGTIVPDLPAEFMKGWRVPVDPHLRERLCGESLDESEQLDEIWPTAFVQRREPAGQETPNGTGIEYHTG